MKTNIGSFDKWVRFTGAAILLLAVLLQWVTGPLTWIAGTVAFILFLTAFLNLCPLYKVLGINTTTHNHNT